MIGAPDILAMFEVIVNKVNSKLFAKGIPEAIFDYGRYIEVTRNLTEKGQGISPSVRKKYPLIWVVVPYTVENIIAGVGAEITDMQIIIATGTDNKSTTKKRIAENFIPVLRPVYYELMNQIDRSGFFNDIDLDNNHKYIEQPYWDGKDGSSVANLFDDFIDAIQLKNIRLKINESTCDRFRLVSGVGA